MTSLDAVRAALRNEGLPFADILTEASIREVLNDHGVKFRDRVYSPVTTIWGFLSQVLSEDHSCRDAVSRIIAHRASNGKTVCSPNTASYCNARSRIPTECSTHFGDANCGRVTGERLPTNGSGTVDLCSSSMALTSRCQTRQRIKRCTHSRHLNSRVSDFRSPESGCCCRWQPALVTIWPLPRTKARAPVKRISSDECTTPSNPAMWFLPTPYSTITSSPANCASAISTSLLTLSTSAREVGQ